MGCKTLCSRDKDWRVVGLSHNRGLCRDVPWRARFSCSETRRRSTRIVAVTTSPLHLVWFAEWMNRRILDRTSVVKDSLGVVLSIGTSAITASW